jgi:hypothetical protein
LVRLAITVENLTIGRVSARSLGRIGEIKSNGWNAVLSQSSQRNYYLCDPTSGEDAFVMIRTSEASLSRINCRAKLIRYSSGARIKKIKSMRSFPIWFSDFLPPFGG